MAQTELPTSAVLLTTEEIFVEERIRGAWEMAGRRLWQNKAAVISLVLIVLLCLVAIFAPLIARFDPNEVHFGDIQTPPAWLQGGTWTYPLGTDGLGRDLLSRLIYSSRISLVIGLSPILFYIVIGGGIGLVAGYGGSLLDNVLMRFTDVFFALPDLLIIITLVTLLRDTALGNAFSGILIIVLALGLFGWVVTARLVRGQVLTYRELAFVESARALGASPGRVVMRHIVPHVLAPVIVQMTFTIPAAIVAEAVLSFIGIGIRPPTATWGNMIQDGYGAIQSQPAMALGPAACIAFVTITFTFLGDGLRDALDPQQRV